MQLAMPEMFGALGRSPQSDQLESMLLAVRRHADGLHSLLKRLRALPNPDEDRADLLSGIAADHPGSRVIAFRQYAETVREL